MSCRVQAAGRHLADGDVDRSLLSEPQNINTMQARTADGLQARSSPTVKEGFELQSAGSSLARLQLQLEDGSHPSSPTTNGACRRLPLFQFRRTSGGRGHQASSSSSRRSSGGCASGNPPSRSAAGLSESEKAYP